MERILRWLGGCLLLASGVLAVFVKAATFSFMVGPQGILIGGSASLWCLLLGGVLMGYGIYLQRHPS